jgi:hypothetical protein
MGTQIQEDPVGGDAVSQFAVMLSRFSRRQSINANAAQTDGDPVVPWRIEDERTLLLASGLFAMADQLQRLVDALTAPEPLPLSIPTGDEDTFLVAD